MNPYTGNLTSNPLKMTDDHVELPPSLHAVARKKLAGRDEAQVSLTSGGALSRWAATQRRAAKKKAGKRKAKRLMAKRSRRANR